MQIQNREQDKTNSETESDLKQNGDIATVKDRGGQQNSADSQENQEECLHLRKGNIQR
jgi:hypothetical protein